MDFFRVTTGGKLTGFVGRNIDSFFGLVSAITSKGDCSLSFVSLTITKRQFNKHVEKIRDALGVLPRTDEVEATRREEVLLGKEFASDGLRLANAIVSPFNKNNVQTNVGRRSSK